MTAAFPGRLALTERQARGLVLGWVAQTCVTGLVPVPPGTVSAALLVGSTIRSEAQRGEAWAGYVALVRAEHDLAEGRRCVATGCADCARRSAAAAHVAALRSAEALERLLGDDFPSVTSDYQGDMR